jgi:hypothetical protein
VLIKEEKVFVNIRIYVKFDWAYENNYLINNCTSQRFHVKLNRKTSLYFWPRCAHKFFANVAVFIALSLSISLSSLCHTHADNLSHAWLSSHHIFLCYERRREWKWCLRCLVAKLAKALLFYAGQEDGEGWVGGWGEGDRRRVACKSIWNAVGFNFTRGNSFFLTRVMCSVTCISASILVNKYVAAWGGGGGRCRRQEKRVHEVNIESAEGTRDIFCHLLLAYITSRVHVCLNGTVWGAFLYCCL